MKKVIGVILYCCLSFLSVFLIAGWVAKLFGIGANQGLASGAIVLFRAFIMGVLGLGLALIIYVKRKPLPLLKINLILLLILGLTILLLLVTPKKSSKPAKPFQDKASLELSYVDFNDPEETHFYAKSEKKMGLGLFTPNFFENRVLYFYANLNLEKALDEHHPIDSITFKINEHNSYDIKTAPPWLKPEHLKMDYDMLFFKVLGITEEFVEVVVNTANIQTFFVSRYAGEIKYWPEFLLAVNSIEFNDLSDRKVHARHFESSSEINLVFEVMRAVQIKGDWAKVHLLDDSRIKLGTGWIRWRKCENLLVRYNLLG